MILFAHVLSLLAVSVADPVERAQALLSSTQGFSSSISVSVPGRGTVVGSYACRSPLFQRFRLSNAKDDSEFLQTRTATLLVYHSDKEYQWEPAFSQAVDVPPEGNLFLRLGHPLFLAARSFDALVRGSQWKPSGAETVRGVATDKVVCALGTSGESAALWIDPIGRVLRYLHVVATPDGPIEVTCDFIDPKYAAPPEKVFELRLPEGYTASVPPRQAFVARTGDALALPRALTWPGRSDTDLAKVGTIVPCLVAFTSVDLGGQSVDLASLAAAAKQRGVRFIQVWLGQEPVDKKTPWEQYWDRTGAVEKAAGVPGTPYFMGLTQGHVATGWFGWSPDDLVEAVGVLIKPLVSGDYSPKTRSAKINATKSSTGSGGD